MNGNHWHHHRIVSSLDENQKATNHVEDTIGRYPGTLEARNAGRDMAQRLALSYDGEVSRIGVASYMVIAPGLMVSFSAYACTDRPCAVGQPS